MGVLVTGATRGIGRALFDLYRAEGVTVTGTTRGRPQGPDWVRLDVEDARSVAALPDALADRDISLLVCNAGVYLDKGERLGTGYGAALWARTFAVNVTGVFLTVQALLPRLRTSTNPRIAIVASQMGSSTRASGGSYIYRASKAAAINLGRNLARDLAGDGIAVGIYHPGWVRTDMGGSAAEISPTQSAAGLKDRFEALRLETTGCFETWDGREHAF